MKVNRETHDAELAAFWDSFEQVQAAANELWSIEGGEPDQIGDRVVKMLDKVESIALEWEDEKEEE